MATYIPFVNGDVVETTERVFASAWTNNTNDLEANHFTASSANTTGSTTDQANFFTEIYNADPTGTSEVQYSIAYGNRNGSGSLLFNTDSGNAGNSPSKAIYNQYRTLVFGGDETQNFTFDGHTPDGIYVINVNRSRYKGAIRLGNVAIQLSPPASDNIPIKLTDDSVTTSGSAAAVRSGVGREFNIVSGALGQRKTANTLTYVANSGSYGFIYPDAGLIILNQDALDGPIASGGLALGTNVGSNDNNPLNTFKLRESLISGSSFILDSQEDIASKFYFIRVKNQEFNYTTNDSFTENDGTLKHDSMIDNPETYITTVGLYDDNQDLLAVAKLSQPLPKDFTKEALIKVKLDY
jgi:hypothetical protein